MFSTKCAETVSNKNLPNYLAHYKIILIFASSNKLPILFFHFIARDVHSDIVEMLKDDIVAVSGK